MAALGTAGSAVSAGANTAPTVAVTTPAVGDLIVVFVNVQAAANKTTISCSDAGSTYTRVTAGLWSASTSTVAAFVRDALAPSTTTLTATVAGVGTNNSWAIGYQRITGMGVAGAAAIRTFGVTENGGSGTTPAVTLSGTSVTGSLVMGMVGNAVNPATLTPPAGWTEKLDIGVAGISGLEMAGIASGFTSNTVTWGSTTSTAYGGIAFELDAGAHGVAAVTLDDATPAATGAIKVQGALTATLADATGVETFKEAANFNLAVTLQDVVTHIAGTLSATLENARTTTGAFAKINYYTWPNPIDQGTPGDPLGEFDLSTS